MKQNGKRSVKMKAYNMMMNLNRNLNLELNHNLNQNLNHNLNSLKIPLLKTLDVKSNSYILC